MFFTHKVSIFYLAIENKMGSIINIIDFIIYIYPFLTQIRYSSSSILHFIKKIDYNFDQFTHISH